MASWPDDQTLDNLFAQASRTRSGALAFDPEAPGGFRVLTDDEDQQLIDAIRLPEPAHREPEHAEVEQDELEDED